MEAFTTWLSELFRLRGAGPRFIEACIHNIVCEVPLPPRGRRQVQFGVRDVVLQLRRPPINSNPTLIDASSISLLFQLLDVHNFFKVFAAIVTEQPTGETKAGTVSEAMLYANAHMLMHALKGLACRARVTPASLHALPCSGEALASPASLACGCAKPFRARFRTMQYGGNIPHL